MELKETITNIPSIHKTFEIITEALMNNYTIKIIVKTTNGNVKHEYKVTTNKFKVILYNNEIIINVVCDKTSYIQDEIDMLNVFGEYQIHLSKIKEIKIYK